MSSQVCRFFPRLKFCFALSLSRVGVDVITLDERSNIDFLINVSYHSIRGKETYQKEKENISYRKISFNCHFVNSIVHWPAQVSFSPPFPASNGNQMAFRFHFVLCCFSLCLFNLASRLKDNLSTLTIRSATIHHIVSLHTRTRARVHSMFNTWQGEKRNI